MPGPAPTSLAFGGDRGAWRIAVAALHALAAAALLAWRPGGATALAAVVIAAAGLWSWRTAAALPRLAWDGACWRLDRRPVDAEVLLDLGGWMLLTLRAGPGRRVALPVSAAATGAAWPALRTHLFAAPRRDTP